MNPETPVAESKSNFAMFLLSLIWNNLTSSLLSIVITFGILLAITIWVYRDAKRSGRAAVLWAFLVFVATCPFLIFYLDTKYHWRASKTVVFILLFLFLLFPFGDLNDLVTSQVSKLTQNTVFLQFDDMHINPITTSVTLDKVVVETPQISALTSDTLKISPSIFAAFKRQPGGSLVATGFLNGGVEINIAPGETTGDIAKSNIDITATDISLSSIRDVINFNIPLKGQLSLSSQTVADLSLSEQPDMELSLTISKFELPSTTVNTGMMGAVNVPEIKFDKVELKGKLSAGKFVIESGKLGSSRDDFYGDIKGDFSLKLVKIGTQVQPQFGTYDLSVDLKANTAFQQRAQLFLSFLDSTKSSLGSTATYKFRLQGDPNNFSSPFLLTPIR